MRIVVAVCLHLVFGHGRLQFGEFDRTDASPSRDGAVEHALAEDLHRDDGGNPNGRRALQSARIAAGVPVSLVIRRQASSLSAQPTGFVGWVLCTQLP
jgi:hypothetical protein